MEDSIGLPVVNGFLMLQLGSFKDMTIRSLNGRLTGVQKVLCSAAEIECKGRRDFYLGHDGGYMIPIHSKSGQGLSTKHFQFLPEPRSETHRDKQCEQGSAVGKRVCRAVRSQV